MGLGGEGEPITHRGSKLEAPNPSRNPRELIPSQAHIQGANKPRAALEVQSPAVSIRDLLRTSAKCTKHLFLPQKPHSGLGAGPTAPTAAPALLPPAARADPVGLDPREWLNPEPLSCKHPRRRFWGAGCLPCGTALPRAAAGMEPCKPSLQKSLTQSCCICLSMLGDQSQPWLVAGAASSAPPAPKFVGFQLCYYTQARRYIHVISSCKGQQARPRAALS